MQNHYFIENNALADDVRSFPYSFGGISFTFTSNSGMFSPGRVDAGTDVLLRHLPEMEGSLLDLGCGYGVVGVVLARCYGLEATLSDVNGRALEYAARNCRQNGVTARIVESDGFSGLTGPFRQIVLNPPIHAGKQTVFRLYEGAAENLLPGGRLYLVIQEKHGARSSLKKLTELFGGCETLYKKAGYYVLACVKQ